MISYMCVEEDQEKVLIVAMPCMVVPGMALLTLQHQDTMLGVVYGREGGWLQEGQI